MPTFDNFQRQFGSDGCVAMDEFYDELCTNMSGRSDLSDEVRMFASSFAIHVNDLLQYLNPPVFFSSQIFNAVIYLVFQDLCLLESCCRIQERFEKDV